MPAALLKFTAHGIPSPLVGVRSPYPSLTSFPETPLLSLCRFSSWRPSRVSLLYQRKASNGDEEVTPAGELRECSVHSNGGNGDRSAKASSAKELMQRLKAYGVAGVLSYGLLNTLYYLTTFLLVWFYFAPSPGKMGYAAAVERFLRLMAMVWAGSQVTKLVRAGGLASTTGVIFNILLCLAYFFLELTRLQYSSYWALAMAPVVDRGLSWFTVKFKFASKGKAFAAIVGMCFGLALLLFLGLTLLWA